MRGFVDFRSAREETILAPGRAEETRRWRAVSQRVPRDAYRRIAKTDVFGLTQHPGRRDAVSPPEANFAKAMSHSEGLTLSRRFEKRTYERSPDRSDLGSALRICDARSPPGSEAVRSGESSSLSASLCTSIILQ